MTKHLRYNGVEFYRDEFNYCDRNQNDILSRKEILYCDEVAKYLMNEHMKNTMNDPVTYIGEILSACFEIFDELDCLAF